MQNLSLKKWRSGERSLGGWSNLPDIHIAELLARSGLDWICFDLQHGLMEYSDLTRLLPAITGQPVTPIVRVADNQPDQIGKALDAGAQGIIVPMVNSVAEARSAVDACRYPPLGNRSCGPMRPLLIEGMSYLTEANSEIACLAMIETQAGLDAVDAIAAEPGIDGLFVGPVDLCFGLGITPGDFGNDKFAQAIAMILGACERHGKFAGMFGYSPELAGQALEQGFTFASLGTDISFLRDGVTGAFTRSGCADQEPAATKEEEPTAGY
ncbi:aldolase/citrate lyase family protein [Congregibacter variabilis]|uniref:Aldolase/citrate lyase family protein n=1 Tax=Congregibacter variabilis TaxID=3081200 RepID=A0ABZ0I9N2_9GAMM|nr:aldolase/citrate lyase family protein [Congregibacter sp. IMCC43200]